MLLLLFCFVALPILLTFFSLLVSHPRHQVATDSPVPSQESGFRAFFAFRTPSSLFPPSAVISLTDDNSTFFLARPAAFGPRLPEDGLSGQLWAEDRLGCSDVSGWKDGHRERHGDTGTEQSIGDLKAPETENAGEVVKPRGRIVSELPGVPDTAEISWKRAAADAEDGTDNHLHSSLQSSDTTKSRTRSQYTQHNPVKSDLSSGHADIQSLQESAEINGKIVLLSRGGCGFVEKVKWVQRRGGKALIVGADTRGGGPLITMYAHGDTSNITVPSLFTSHTTAQILSSLISLEQFDEPEEDSAKAGRKASGTTKTDSRSKLLPNRKNDGTRSKNMRLGSTNLASTHVQSGTPANSKTPSSTAKGDIVKTRERRSWFHSITSAFRLGHRSDDPTMSEDSRRPPSSGRINWIVSDNWYDEPDVENTKVKQDKIGKEAAQSTKNFNTGDDFEIGIQDWRDPDLVAVKEASAHSDAVAKAAKGKSMLSGNAATSKTSATNQRKDGTSLAGGSITPGSGEYGDSSGQTYKVKSDLQDKSSKNIGTAIDNEDSESNNWFSQMVWGDDRDSDHQHTELSGAQQGQVDVTKKHTAKHQVEQLLFGDVEDDIKEHDGLWVTLTPATISSSPFFDTLLVLVVSPLVTLTVVYGMLMLRSRIRRRRWRAPKSVVDRLPVRTYHTMSCASSSTSSHISSARPPSRSLPPLSNSPHALQSRPRPRSRTTTGIGEAASAPLNPVLVNAPLLRQEKGASQPAYKVRYSGRQVECVVCLEEYIDGQSRVMSLPCGHEFHAECMYVSHTILHYLVY